MEVYLDNSATTKCLESVKEIMVRTMEEDFGNPSSMHVKGVQAEGYIKHARKIIAGSLKVQPKEIFFTSGGTESNNWAVIGCAMANQRRGRHLITTRIEHPSVKNPMKYLEKMGFEVSYLGVDEYGIINMEQLEKEIREDTILISIIHVNNEIGAVQPLEKIAKLIKQKNPSAYLHIDSIQGFGKFRIYPKQTGVDMLSISGHKIHGPKGVGILYIQDKVKIQPILFGGGQQKDMRSGTENVSGIAGIGKAVEESYKNFDEKISHLYALRKQLIDRLQSLDGVTINGYQDNSNSPHIVSANFDGIGSEILLHSLEDKGIYVSSGSACASNKQAASDTLQAIGLSRQQIKGTIRFSLCTDNTEEEIQYCYEVIKELLPVLRKYRRH